MADDLRAPLTPDGCDLRGLPFMPLDVIRLVDSNFVALTTGDEFKAGVLLWAKSWNQIPGASLPDDDRVLAHLSGAGARWKKVKAMALHGWIKCSDGRLYHPVVAEKARDAWEHRQSQRARAAKRWHGHDTSSGNATDDAAAHATADTTAHAVASPTAMQGTGTVKGEGREEEPPNPHRQAMGEPKRSSIDGRKGLRSNGTSPRQIAAAAEAARPPPPEPEGPLWPILRARGMSAAEYRVMLASAEVRPDDHHVVIPSSFSRSRIQAEHGAALEAAGWRISGATP